MPHLLAISRRRHVRPILRSLSRYFLLGLSLVLRPILRSLSRYFLLGLSLVLCLAIAIPHHAHAADPPPSQLTAPARLNQQGEQQLEFNHPQAALELWQQAEKQYQAMGDRPGQLGSQINQARALQALGFYRRAKTQLEAIATTLAPEPNSTLKALTLLNLGNVLRVAGDLETAQHTLQQSLTIVQQLSQSNATSQPNATSLDIATIRFSLANTLADREKLKAALTLYQQADSATSPVQLQAQIGQIKTLNQLNEPETAKALLRSTLKNLSKFPISKVKVYAQIELAALSLDLLDLNSPAKQNPNNQVPNNQVPSNQNLAPSTNPELLATAQLLATTIQQAQSIQDRRTESLALGQLGHLYETTHQWAAAQRLTHQAWAIAHTNAAPDIAYQWQWQLGRLQVAQGNNETAIAHYIQAYNTLQTLRQDLIAINQTAQFSFRDQIEPIYRELVSLLLQDEPPIPDPKSTAPSTKHHSKSPIPNVKSPIQNPQAKIRLARQVIESLQLAELTNFFHEACIDAKPRAIDQIDPHAAVIYPIVLRDRLEVILALPHQPLRHYATRLPQAQLETAFQQMRQSLRSTAFPAERLAIAQTLHQWLIQPAIADLQHASITTLAFVLDGTLRNLPMAALHDGHQYLIEQYSIALTPGLELFPALPQTSPAHPQALIAGLSASHANFTALPGVTQEITQISHTLAATPLLNQAFTLQALTHQVNTRPLRIVHLATHGQFSAKADQTFIQAWDGRLSLPALANLLANRPLQNLPPIDLLVLSACKTAQGDKHAALGLAGVAVKSGARSTLATLWQVNDDSTATFMTQFYAQLYGAPPALSPSPPPPLTKAAAVRQAQLQLLHSPQYSHPYYWSPFVLIGNWQ